MTCPEGWTLFGQTCWSLPLAGLVLVALGWVVGFRSSVGIERIRQRAAKDIVRKQLEREAVELAFKWIGPMDSAAQRAGSAASAYLWRQIDEDQFRQEWPHDLVSQLVALDVPFHLWPYLPEDAYLRGHEIHLSIYRAFIDVLSTDSKDTGAILQINSRVAGIRDKVKALRDMLEIAHLATLD